MSMPPENKQEARASSDADPQHSPKDTTPNGHKNEPCSLPEQKPNHRMDVALNIPET